MISGATTFLVVDVDSLVAVAVRASAPGYREVARQVAPSVAQV